jgi:hypothetical protein
LLVLATVDISSDAQRPAHQAAKDLEGCNGMIQKLKEAAKKSGYQVEKLLDGLLLKKPHPNLEEIREAMNENLCRCGSYQRMIQAIQDAAREMKGGSLL